MAGTSYLITGGTGSFGHACVAALLTDAATRRVIVFSRDELKQSEMRKTFPDARLEFFVGDVRDATRVRRAFEADLDVVIHAAALKQVPACEYNPLEALKTNVLGAVNIVEAAIDCGIPKVLALSTDKACAALNTYGKTKALSESLFVRGNAYAGRGPTRFSVVRYGNVVGSRGSVIPVFLEQRSTGVVTVTDPRMTRFWMSIEDGVSFVRRCIALMRGGEIFVPRIPSAKLMDLARAVAPGCRIEVTGIRPGEKLHEVLVSEDEGAMTYAYEDGFVIMPTDPSWSTQPPADATLVPEGFQYSSDRDPISVTYQEIAQCVSP